MKKRYIEGRGDCDMFGVVRIGDQRVRTVPQGRSVFHQQAGPTFNQDGGMQYLFPQQVFYQVPQGNGWEMISRNSFANADHMQNRTAVNWNIVINSSQMERQQEEECRKWLKEISDAGAKETEQTDLLASTILEAFGVRMADNSIEAAQKTANTLQKLGIIFRNRSSI